MGWDDTGVAFRGVCSADWHYHPGACALQRGPHFFPPWLKSVLKDGRSADAYLLSGFQEFVSGVGGYEGSELWIELPVRVEPQGTEAFEAQMKCRLSPAWVLEKGRSVSVRYDPKNRRRVMMA
jgi:hypothetical protein